MRGGSVPVIIIIFLLLKARACSELLHSGLCMEHGISLGSVIASADGSNREPAISTPFSSPPHAASRVLVAFPEREVLVHGEYSGEDVIERR